MTLPEIFIKCSSQYDGVLDFFKENVSRIFFLQYTRLVCVKEICNENNSLIYFIQ